MPGTEARTLGKRLLSPINGSLSFIGRQHRDWKVTVVRTSLDRFSYRMVFPYLSIYIVALGASATQLGIVNSVGMAIAGLAAPFIGWFIDRFGPKRLYLLGIALVGLSYFTYGVAQSWTFAILAMAAYWLGTSGSGQSCATVCGNCLSNQDRATGMTFCETVTAGLLGMAGPMLGALLVARAGGASVEGIRPLFFVGLAVSLGGFLIVVTQLSDRKWHISHGKPAFFQDIRQVFREGHHLKRWLIIASVGMLPTGMIFPFSQVFAYEVKGAQPYILGAMVTGSALASTIFAIPLGSLADRIGRKKVLYVTVPLFWLSSIVLVWAPGPAFLVTAGVLQGFYYIGAPIVGAMERELVPAAHMGRWLGMARLVRMLLNACMVLIAGIVWDKIGPQYVFLGVVVLDLAIRVPLLISMPETLNLRLGKRGIESPAE
ncbi:MAG: MFS transporter [Chloroflexi bacterium]|nr:MFS transporter [Chloroflexota bacterium]